MDSMPTDTPMVDEVNGVNDVNEATGMKRVCVRSPNDDGYICHDQLVVSKGSLVLVTFISTLITMFILIAISSFVFLGNELTFKKIFMLALGIAIISSLLIVWGAAQAPPPI
jgi:hypothetical protein